MSLCRGPAEPAQVEGTERLGLPAGSEISAPRFSFLFVARHCSGRPESIPFLVGSSPGQIPSPPKQQELTRVLRVIYSPRKKKLALRRGRGEKKKKKSSKIFVRIQIWEKRLRISGNKYVARHNISILQRQWQ